MKKILTLLLIILLASSFTNTISANDTKIIDEANVLNENEEKDINSLINDFISKTNFDIVIYFTYQNSYYDKYAFLEAITRLADDTYDHNGYGIGQDHDGLIMCVDVYYRDYTITTCGDTCINTYTDRALDGMYDNISYYLSDDNWANACKEFISSANYVFDNFDYYHQDLEDHDSLKYHIQEALLPSVVAAFVITIVYFFILKGQLKHISEKYDAYTYIKSKNINISRRRDIYLYTNVSRTKIEKPSSSSGSSTHSSSSGVSHGGGGSHRF